jgi:hypothetical protein
MEHLSLKRSVGMEHLSLKRSVGMEHLSLKRFSAEGEWGVGFFTGDPQRYVQ